MELISVRELFKNTAAYAGKEVTVYTTSGTLVLRVPNYNGEPLPLPTGVYVVRTGNASKKMVVK